MPIALIQPVKTYIDNPQVLVSRADIIVYLYLNTLYVMITWPHTIWNERMRTKVGLMWFWQNNGVVIAVSVTMGG